MTKKIVRVPTNKYLQDAHAIEGFIDVPSKQSSHPTSKYLVAFEQRFCRM